MMRSQIQEILRLHALWLQGDSAGRRADFSGANLSRANLYGTNLSRSDLSNVNFFYVNLSSANLFCVNLSSADLSSADLSSANLSNAILSGANLSNAILSDANLSRADLSRANLSRVNFCHTNLSGTNLSGANFSGTNLFGAEGFAPSMMLLADWGDLSDDLCKLAMAYDASGHADPEAFDRWKETGDCPYKNKSYKRLCRFHEKRSLWDPTVKAPRAFDLMVALIKEKCANSDWH